MTTGQKMSKKSKRPVGILSGSAQSASTEDKGPYAVLVANLYHSRFRPLSRPHCLLPLVGVPLLHYSLTRLIQDGFREILIYACSDVQQVKDYCKSSTACYQGAHISVHNGEGSRSLGDVMRDLDQSQVVRSMTDFLLVPADLISATPLLPLVQKHEFRRETNGNAILTLCFPSIASSYVRSAQVAEWAVTTVYSRSGDYRLMRLIERSDASAVSTAHVSLFELARSDACIEVRSDLMDLGIAVCSNHIPPLFQDNFDYQTMHDLVHDVLTNEEILGYTIHVEPLSSIANSALHLLAAPDLTTLIHSHFVLLTRTGVSSDCMPPLLSSSFGKDSFRSVGPYAYINSTASIHPSVRLIGPCLIGPRCTIERDACLINCILDADCFVGEKAHLRHVIVEKDVHISAGVRADMAWLGRRARLLERVRLPRFTYIGPTLDKEAVPLTVGPGRVALPEKTVLIAPDTDANMILSTSVGGEKVWAAMYSNHEFQRKASEIQNTHSTDNEDSDASDDSSKMNVCIWDTAEDRLRLVAKRQRQKLTGHNDIGFHSTGSNDLRRSNQRDRYSSATARRHPSGRHTPCLGDNYPGSGGEEAQEGDDGEQSEVFLIGELRHTLEHGFTFSDANSQESSDNIILEINSLKHAYNIPIEDLHFLLIKALLELTQSRIKSCVTENEYQSSQTRTLIAEFRRQLTRLDPVFKSYRSALEDGRVCMQALEDTACYHSMVLQSSPFLTHALYDHELVTEGAVWWWLDNSPLLSDEELVNQTAAIRVQMKPFLTWLKEAEEEDEEDGSDDEE